MTRRSTTLCLLAAALLTFAGPARAQTTVKKVVLQGFWWDYYNDAYRFKWADYLTEMAPRLKSMGIDAVWIPPTPKNKNATNDVGYSPFDHYDLGDKFQKGDTRTRFGSKDEFLRMVAVLHANGIEVIQDVVLNHIDGAGGTYGYGGQDPETAYSTRTNAGYKSFRYASFATPAPQTEPAPSAATETSIAAEYLNRQGRWPKNYANFHPHLGHNSTSGDMADALFGPDFCFGDDGGGDGYGGLSGAVKSQFSSVYDPAQGSGYSRNQARNWIVWLKKQTGVDGFRWDAVKHFSYAVQQDLSSNLKYNAGWASGGNAMFNVGEYVGEGGTLDSYVGAVQGQNGGSEFLMGTFDFGLRSALYGMVTGNGGFDMGSIPSRQQGARVAQYGSGSSAVYVHRTVPFVNNHDTFRPQVDATGNYTGWNGGSELAPHINPFDPRLSAAYAVAFAVDGSPQIFFEDLFDIGGTGKRFNHLATSTTDLPVRSDLVNLLWCHQNLRFKDGAYKVRWQAQDHLVIERGARAIIGINDSFNSWQETYVDSDFAPGTVLVDYSGANGTYEYTVPQDQRVRINTPPCNGSALGGRRGYSVWAPKGQGTSYSSGRPATTTQEWEMANDLGDLNCNGLGQGGALPDNSTTPRLVGKIYALAGQPVTYEVFPEANGNTRSLTVGVFDLRGTQLSSASGTASAAGTYTPSTTGWLSLKVRNTSSTYAGQRCFVKASYTAPAAVDTRSAAAPRNAVAIWTGANRSADPADCRNWENGVEPNAGTDVLIPAGTSLAPSLSSGALAARSLTIENGASLTLAAGTTLHVTGNVVAAGTLTGAGTLELDGTTPQTLSSGSAAALTLNNLTISNVADVRLLSPLTVAGTLALNAGHLALDDYNLTLAAAAEVVGADATRYLLTKDGPVGGYVVRAVPAGNAAVTFPVGSATAYAPVTLRNTGTASDFKVRTFSGVLENGTSGAAYSRRPEFVNRTWDIVPTLAAGPVVGVVLQWNQADENASFDRSRTALYRNAGGAGSSWTNLGPMYVMGGNGAPYRASFAAVSSFASFAVGNGPAAALAADPLPVELLHFSARRTGPGTVRLDWATATEKDNAGFDLEKSSDGRTFRTLSTLAPRGGSQPTAYTYTETGAEAATAAYYRLRQRDLDGRTTVSPVLFVAAAQQPLAVLPNPSRGGTLQLLGGPVAATELTPLRLTLTEVHGRILLAPAPAPRAVLAAQLSTALAQAAPGVYVLTLTGADGQPQRLRLVRE